ncbi:nuclear pore complex protein Nup205 [Drosophila grimshawi]|uniref:GH24436 n=1 Tax=Drosophila grimshawi TaxID=7222 RepID=B4JLX7_DROGR|nr:nuclear pore complex protein Nup205 [Drosophila grimshawi]EDV91738.1 GH24436 [Drosophila grimshawi]
MDSVIEDMWTPYKRLYQICQSAIRNPNEMNPDLVQCLKKHKQNFTNLLRNPPKSEKSRAQLATISMEGVMLAGQSRKVVLSQELINEAIILSDMYDLDEIIALELLCSAQRQQIRHPGLPRGLVAVLLYYDGRKAITCTLRDMFQAMSGVTWSTELPKEMTVVFDNYVQNLVEDSNILGRLLELLAEMDTEKEIALLTKNRAFGSKRHQNQVLALYESTRKALAMCLFHWSAQRGLPKNIAIRLLKQLANNTQGNTSEVTLIMLMALLYGYDTSVLLLAECDNQHISRLPILSDPEYVKCFYEAIYAQTTWQTPQMDVIIKYSFGLTLASLRQAPIDLQTNAGAIINCDEQLIDEALAGNVFTFFLRELLETNVVYEVEFIYRRLHQLITDFIDFMHAKVSELRGRSDETARVMLSFQNAGLESPPNLDDNFELLMLCVAKLYGDKRIPVTLCNEYWGPTIAKATTTTPHNAAANSKSNTSRAVSLFKFIRLASELLPQILMTPYLKMIAGLTRTEFAARAAFNLLKDSQNVSSTYAVSWDNFFTALNCYFTNMRSDQQSIGGSIYRSRPMPRNIAPSETEIMISVLGIVQAVADNDEISRIVICEHVNWQTPQVLLGLLACTTSVALKGQILLTLAALSKSKESARSIWFHLEESQVIPTMTKNSSAYASFSLAEEIVQNECRMETYKLSRGVLQLLNTLMTTHMPHRLGAGQRKGGYDPYLHFVIDKIFLKFYNRAYKDPVERWEVGAKCMQLLYFLLATYQPKAADFDNDRDDYPHPGYHIMLQLQVKSDMLRLILRIIEEAQEQLDDYNEFRGKPALEECALYALLLLEVAVAKQNAFFEAANCSILLMGLNRMLLDLNPRSRQPDYVHNIIKFVTYNSWLPRHTLAAIKILSGFTAQPDVVVQILNMYSPNSTEKLEIRRQFIECLEIDMLQLSDEQRRQYEALDRFGNAYHKDATGDAGDLDSNTSSVSDTISVSEMEVEDRQPMRIELQIKEAIVQLFEVNINQPLPNFVTFLLGIDVMRDFMYNEQIQLNVNCSCINALVLILERHLEQQRQSDKYCEHTAHIVERIYRLFHGFCASPQISEAILRYFRLTCNDFLLRHLGALPFRNNHRNHMLHAISHLMNCVSIEIRVAASHGQTTRYTLLCDILLAVNADVLHNGHSVPQELSTSLLMSAAGNQFGLGVTPCRQMMQTTAPELHANRLLDCLTLETLSLTQPDLEFFDERLVSTLLTECTANAAMHQHSAGVINIHKLHCILMDELHLVQSSIANGQRKAVIDEITTLIQYAINLNGIRMQRLATYAFMKAWGNLVQLLFSAMPETVLPVAVRKQHIIDIIEKIMFKVPPTQPLVKLSIQVTETMLVLLENLRHCYYHLEDQRALDEHGNIICLNDATPGVDATIANNQQQQQQQAKNSAANNATHVISSSVSSNSCKSSNLRFILKQLIAWIMTCEVKSQQLSINLYTSLLYCLRIVKRVRSDEQIEYNETLRTRSDSCTTFGNLQADVEQEMKHKEMAAEIISEFGEKLIDTICHDVTTGHAMCSMLALSCLDIISELRAVNTLCDIIASRGYLKQVLYGLAQSDVELKDVLKPIPDSLRPLYMYESLMAFLMQMAQTYLGATQILAEGALGVLSNMRIYDMQPDLKASQQLTLERNEPDDFMPAVDARFRSILLPALSFCDSIIDSLGARNTSASTQLLNFLFSHIDMIEGMLRAATPFMGLGHLQQLAAITNIFARITCNDQAIMQDHHHLDSGAPSPEMTNRLSRLRQLLIVVLGRFTVNEATIRCMMQQERHQQQDPTDLTEVDKWQHIKYILDISANLSIYCRAGVTSHVRDGITSKYLLTTMINDVTPLSGKTDSKKLSAIMVVILNQLKGSIAYYLSQKAIADNLVQQRASLPNITFGPSGKKNYLELSQRHNDKRSELKMSVFIAEQSLYLLWIHVDFYFRNAVIYSQENRSLINETCLDPNNMSVLNASQDEIVQLKQMLISTFNELFCSQLITASEGYTTKCKNFSAVLLRRIKALVQFAPQTS